MFVNRTTVRRANTGDCARDPRRAVVR
jgi:hypothetical protein